MSPAKYNRYANTTDITVKDKSVISKKTIEQISNSDINALISMGKEKPVDNGTTERQMRNQFRAWVELMAGN